jgi:GNAT superfamily N-acetyltransferase
MELFISDIEALWKKLNAPPGIRDTLNKKVDDILNDKIKGIMLFEDDAPVGVAWVEIVGIHYGNIVFHHLKDGIQEILVNEMKKSGLTDGYLTELIKFNDPNQRYADAMVEEGYHETVRQRMALDFKNDDINILDNFDGVEFREITKDDIPVTSKISFDAHHVSLDQPFSPDLKTLERRQRLERYVHTEDYGKIIRPATQLMFINNVPIGLTMAVEISCWGLEKMPWIFDVCIDPEYLGRGYGKILFHNCMSTLRDMGYEMVGLAVTCNNVPAMRLYEKMGFFFVEEFSEFILPETR